MDTDMRWLFPGEEEAPDPNVMCDLHNRIQLCHKRVHCAKENRRQPGITAILRM